jgi:hypothetical protein
MAEKARHRWQNYSKEANYVEIEKYCRIKASESNN